MENREIIVDTSVERKREEEQKEMGELALELYEDQNTINKIKKTESVLCFAQLNKAADELAETLAEISRFTSKTESLSRNLETQTDQLQQSIQRCTNLLQTRAVEAATSTMSEASHEFSTVTVQVHGNYLGPHVHKLKQLAGILEASLEEITTFTEQLPLALNRINDELHYCVYSGCRKRQKREDQSVANVNNRDKQ